MKTQATKAPPSKPAAEPLAAAPQLFRDRWAWASALAVLPIVIHAWGAPLGEAVAEDFDFLHRVLFSRTHTLLDGGGSTAFWRPVAHQLYYETFGGLIMNHPGVLATLHVLMLAFASLLLYRSFRQAWPGPAAMVVATFPLLSESTRTVISWPSHFVELGVWMFTAIAIHETVARRLWSTLIAVLAALLCKEVAVVSAVLLPWMPGVISSSTPASNCSKNSVKVNDAALIGTSAIIKLLVSKALVGSRPLSYPETETLRRTCVTPQLGSGISHPESTTGVPSFMYTGSPAGLNCPSFPRAFINW